MILDRVHTLEGTVGKNVKKVILTTYLGWPCEFSLIFNVLDMGFRGFLEGVLFSWVPTYEVKKREFVDLISQQRLIVQCCAMFHF